ncbi:MAG: 30S ribosomal protein S20 [Syntrophomonadaceae bacterium]|nr:30S ribosomal protein S20 [Syntrophomonadaceae bacterium]
MAKSKTPAKRARIAEENRLRNKAQKTRLKNAIKTYEAALASNDTESAQANLANVISLVDKNVSKGILHKNNAARKKSALTKKFNQISQPS